MLTTLSDRLHALSHQAQRQLLVALSHHNPQDDTPVNVDTLVDDEAVEILFDFQHYHLPDLEAEGFIDYDRENHTITKGINFSEIEPFLDLIDNHTDELPADWI